MRSSNVIRVHAGHKEEIKCIVYIDSTAFSWIIYWVN